MSRYIVRVVGPAGRNTYLAHGHEVENQENATHYPHPSNACSAALRYLSGKPSVIADVIDTRDPERQVSQ